MAIAAGTSAAEAATEKARKRLLDLQDPAGWWKGELETNVTMDAEDLLLRAFLGISDAAKTAPAAAWIRSQQSADGSWANFFGGPGDVSTSVEAYLALRHAGDPPNAAHMQSAAEFVRAAGGVAAARVFTHIWLALFGLWSWDEVPALPPEIMMLPPRVPLNIYDFGCWARQTLVALSIVLAMRPVRPLGVDLDELQATAATARSRPIERALASGDALLRAYGRRPLRRLRERALARAEAWIVRRQEADGSWGGIQPPWVYSLIALSLRGYPLDHPVMRAGIEGIERFALEEDGTRRLEACQSPVWDTALAVIALSDAGCAADDPALLRAADWLLDQEVTVAGDWAVRRPSLAPGGWAFEFANVNYPDVDDTAEVVLALRRVAHPRIDEAIARAVSWTAGMQSRGGGWGAFDAENTRTVGRLLPFCDFGEVIDDPSADVTAHAVEMLAGERQPVDEGLRWLLAAQEADGSWFGRWGVNHVYGTAAAVPALAAAGVKPGHSAVRGAVAWLERHQNGDGGWGEDCRSYDDPAWRGRGASTPSQTAWALLALHAADADGDAARRGVDWLVERQLPDGGWDEPQHTGTGFPGDFYIKYHLYRLIFPLMALGRWCAA